MDGARVRCSSYRIKRCRLTGQRTPELRRHETLGSRAEYQRRDSSIDRAAEGSLSLQLSADPHMHVRKVPEARERTN